MAGDREAVDKSGPAAGALRIGVDVTDIGTFDPHFSASYQDRLVADMIFNGLVRYKPGEAPEIEPDLVECIPEPERSNGRQIWTFKLRKGVMFHPYPGGSSYELTAEDVVYSLKKSADPARSAYAGDYENMQVDRIDDYTVRITLNEPLSPVLFLPRISNYAGGFIVCKKALEMMGDSGFARRPVGTGPFMFDEYRPFKKAKLAANPDYFRGRPNLDLVEVHFIPDFSQREAVFLNGGLDVIYGLKDTAWIEKMNEFPDVSVNTHGVGEVLTIHFNTSVQPFDDARVRRAAAYAIDRNACLSLFGRKIANNVYSPVPARLLPGGLSRVEAEALDVDYHIDLDKAGSLLVEAGYPDGFELEVVSSDMPAYLMNYRCIKEQLAAVGIDVKIRLVDHSTMHRLIRRDANPLVVYCAWRPNADAYLTRFFHSDSIVVTGRNPDTNFSHYDMIDEIIEDARRETKPSRQIELWKLAQIKILTDMVAYPLHYQNLVHARKNNVDYGHPLKTSMALYPQITEKSRILGSSPPEDR